ncbi:MAG: outer membrane beta-barrel protein, partial [Gemmatimonadota bacterium]|nr:outer membrane beta-barrel protein [Gemmatimonadota bacterium]
SMQLAGLMAGGDLTGQMLEFGLDYIEVPVLLRWNLPIFAGRLRPYLNGGPAFGWRVNCGVTIAVTAGPAGDPTETDCQDLTQENLTETLKDYELGMVVGGGLDVGVLGGMGAITLDFRLTRGLSRISEGQTGPEVRNQAFSAVLGYTFGFF